MKFLLETFLAIIIFFLLTYFLFSIGNGNFNFQLWSEPARNGFSFMGIIEIICILFVQLFRYIDWE